MLTFKENELVSSSQIVKSFASYLGKLKDKSIEKLAILKNNKVEAVIISKDEYELMKEAYDFLEDQKIQNLIKERISKDYKTLSYEDMMSELKLTKKDLED